METVSAQTDLQHEIESLPLVDTHEHLHKEDFPRVRIAIRKRHSFPAAAPSVYALRSRARVKHPVSRSPRRTTSDTAESASYTGRDGRGPISVGSSASGRSRSPRTPTRTSSATAARPTTPH